MTAGNQLFESIASAQIGAPVQSIDMTNWLFELTSGEYEQCSPDHIACGKSRTPDGRRMSINVEFIGGDLLIQHYVDELAQPWMCRVRSTTDLFSRWGRSTIEITWIMSVEAIDTESSRLTNRIVASATPALKLALEAQGVSLIEAGSRMKVLADLHNAGETPWFAKNIEDKIAGRPPKSTMLPGLDPEAAFLTNSQCTAVLDVPIEQVDVSDWLFSLSDQDYQDCSVVHIAAGVAGMTGGRRLSINVEKPNSLLVQRYQEQLSTPRRCSVVSPRSFMLTEHGRSSLHVTWDVSVEPVGNGQCVLTNLVTLRSTPDFEAGLVSSGADRAAVCEQFHAALAAHNAEETPKFAADIVRKVQARMLFPAGAGKPVPIHA